MSVYKSSRSPYYQYDFELRGRRFYGSTKATSKAAALKAERLIKDKLKAELDLVKQHGLNGPPTIRYISGLYWTSVGQYHSGAQDTFRDLERLVTYFGPDKSLFEISDAETYALVAWRRQHTVKGRENAPLISPATVNRSTTEVLKKLFTFAKDTWKLTFHNEPKWAKHWLQEPTERVRELNDGEGEALSSAVRDDYAPWLEFVHATAMRLDESIIEWSHVNWEAKQIVRTGKGGATVVTPITDTIRSILWPLRGHHPKYVFTYVCQRTKNGKIRGKRYPITFNGAQTEWRRTRVRASKTVATLSSFRLHDYRHDTASKVLRATGNLKIVQKALNHKRITTTARYAHVLDEEVAAALESVSKSQKKSRNQLKKVK